MEELNGVASIFFFSTWHTYSFFRLYMVDNKGVSRPLFKYLREETKKILA